MAKLKSTKINPDEEAEDEVEVNVPNGPVDFSKYLTTSKETTFDGTTLLHGPPGVGKTFLAATASAAWPEVLPSRKKVDLGDMLWFQIDAGATAGFLEQRIQVPFVVDVRRAIGDHDLLLGLRGSMDLMEETIDKNPEIGFVVIDTLSILSTLVVQYYEKRAPVSKTTGKVDGWWAYKQIGVRFKDVHSRFTATNRKMIICCHSKVLSDPQDAAQAASMEAKAVPGNFSIVPNIAGGSRDMFVGNASLEGVVKAKKRIKPKLGYDRFFYPMGVGASEGKSRFTRALKREEGPDPNLREMFSRIAAIADGDESVAVDDQTDNED